MSIRIGNNIIASTGSVAGHNKDTSAHPDIRQLIDTKQDKGDYSTRQEVDSKVNAAKSELQTKINAKQDTLVSATNIKTINGQSILGPGNIFIQGGGEGGVESVNGKDGVVVLTGEDLVATVDEHQDTLQGHLQTLANKDESLEAQISTKQNTLIPGENITIEGNVISASGGLSEVAWGNIKGTLSNQTDLQKELDDINDKIEEIELFKFPNAIIAGEPNIDHGQVSDFSNANFLQFPFLVDLTNRRFRVEFCFTTGDDVTTQQNILDSEFGLALAIKNGKGLMAIGHNGTSWAGQVVGSINIQPRTTYYAKLSWNRMNYQTQLSTNGTDYTADMNFGSTQSPYPRTMFIGGSPDLFGAGTAHPFKGSINLNKCFLYIEEQLVWQGMDDAGLATRADISLSNIDAAGEQRIKDLAGGGGASYDWIGTLEQYNAAKEAGEIKPEWVCMITDDVVEDNYMPAFTDLGRVVWNQLLPSASENVKGVVRIATEEETKEATREDLAVNPKNLNALIDTKAQTGKITGMPDWENAQSLTVGQTYTWNGGAGYILQVAHVMKTSNYILTLNGLDLIMQYAVDYDWDSSASTNLIPIKNGDVFKLTYHDGGHGGTSLRYYCFLPILTEEN